MAHPIEFRWTSASCSHVGLVRKINEDSCLDQAERGIWAVADGMGGHALGDYASRMVIEALGRLAPAGALAAQVEKASDELLGVNKHLRAEAALRDVHIIGSTVVALLADNDHCAYLWAGDSRIYLFRGGHLKLITRDHSKLEELKIKGGSVSAKALEFAACNMITRAVGGADTLEVEHEAMEVEEGDMFLLCSDGLSNAVGEQDMQRALASGHCKQAAMMLIDMALDAGGRDNISAIVVRAEDRRNEDTTVLNPALEE